jgi:hypothetical protein
MTLRFVDACGSAGLSVQGQAWIPERFQAALYVHGAVPPDALTAVNP